MKYYVTTGQLSYIVLYTIRQFEKLQPHSAAKGSHVHILSYISVL